MGKVLNEQECRGVVGMALANRRVAALVRGRRVVSAEVRRYGVFPGEGMDPSERTGIAALNLDRPQVVEGVWIHQVRTDCNSTQTEESAYQAKYENVGRLIVFVDLTSGKSDVMDALLTRACQVGGILLEAGDQAADLLGRVHRDDTEVVYYHACTLDEPVELIGVAQPVQPVAVAAYEEEAA